jgi:hypothetical protein
MPMPLLELAKVHMMDVCSTVHLLKHQVLTTTPHTGATAVAGK